MDARLFPLDWGTICTYAREEAEICSVLHLHNSL